MQCRILRASLLYLLVLQMLHLPLPCPDLDGECRGTPILSLADTNAWHPLLLGVRPNDDIDRGPFGNKGSQGAKKPSDSPYGDLAVTATASSSSSLGVSDESECQAPFFAATITLRVAPPFSSSRKIPLNEFSWTLDARTLRACACIWRL